MKNSQIDTEDAIRNIKDKIAELSAKNLNLASYDPQEAETVGYLDALKDVLKLLETGEKLS